MPVALIPKSPLEYMLCKLAEEAAEIIQAVGKIQSFGLDEKYPDTGITNIDQLQLEIFDFRGTFLQVNAELNAAGRDSLVAHDFDAVQRKIDKIRRYSQLALVNGTLAEPLTVRKLTILDKME